MGQLFKKINDVNRISSISKDIIELREYFTILFNTQYHTRGMNFMNLNCKLFTEMVRARFSNWFENNHIFGEEQEGFSKRRSTYDNIFNLFSLYDKIQNLGSFC